MAVSLELESLVSGVSLVGRNLVDSTAVDSTVKDSLSLVNIPDGKLPVENSMVERVPGKNGRAEQILEGNSLVAVAAMAIVRLQVVASVFCHLMH